MFEMGEEAMALPMEEKMKFEQGNEGGSFGFVSLMLPFYTDTDINEQKSRVTDTKQSAQTQQTSTARRTPRNS